MQIGYKIQRESKYGGKPEGKKRLDSSREEAVLDGDANYRIPMMLGRAG